MVDLDIVWDLSLLRCSGRASLQDGVTLGLRVFDSEQSYYYGAMQPPPEQVFHLSPTIVSQTHDRSPPEPLMHPRIGQELWRALPSAATEPLRTALADPAAHPRVRICTSSNLINNLPWEWLSDGLAPRAQWRLRVSRSLPVLVPTPPLTITPPLRLLVVITNPKDERLLNSWQETDAI